MIKPFKSETKLETDVCKSRIKKKKTFVCSLLLLMAGRIAIYTKLCKGNGRNKKKKQKFGRVEESPSVIYIQTTPFIY